MAVRISRYGEEEAAWRKEIKAGDEVLIGLLSPGYSNIECAVAKRVTATLVIVEGTAKEVEYKYSRDTGALRGSSGNYPSRFIMKPTVERKEEVARLRAVSKLRRCDLDKLPARVVVRLVEVLDEELTK